LNEKCLRDDHAALKTASECSLTTSQRRFLACFRPACSLLGDFSFKPEAGP
jgi:hypothetical protein